MLDNFSFVKKCRSKQKSCFRHEVECLSCEKLFARDDIQIKIKRENSEFDFTILEISADGDVFIPGT